MVRGRASPADGSGRSSGQSADWKQMRTDAHTTVCSLPDDRQTGSNRVLVGKSRFEIFSRRNGVDMLCVAAREVTHVQGSIPADSRDGRRHVCGDLLAYREWRPTCMEGA